jgi:SrtB family sortase
MGKFIYSLVLGISIAAIAYVGFFFANTAYNYIQAASGYDSVRSLAGEDSNKDALAQVVGLGEAGDQGGQTSDSIAAAQVRVIDFARLQKENPDVVAWLYIPNSRIDYPVTQTKDNSYYLYYDFYKRKSFAGCLFLDKDANADFTSHDSPVYGHHMRNKSMFGSLNYFRQAAFRSNHQIAFVYLPDRTIKYQFVEGKLLRGKTLPENTYTFDTLTMVTCEYDHVDDHYMVREKILDSREPGQPNPNDPSVKSTANAQ